MVDKDRTAVRLGDGDLKDNIGVQRRLVEKYEIHPKYEEGKPYFDVAVLTIRPEANISSQFVRPICLPKFSSDLIDEFDGDQMDVAGKLVI